MGHTINRQQNAHGSVDCLVFEKMASVCSVRTSDGR